MNEQDIKLTDWERIVLGNVPPEFIIEVIFRMVLIYIAIVIVLRLMGRRMETMLSRGEMVTLVTLGAAMGVTIHAPERGILPSLAVLFMILGMQKLQAYITARNAKAEKLLLDEISVLVVNGVMQVKGMKKCRITRERLLAALRGEGIVNLGVVERVYFEAKGVFSVLVYADGQERPGLCVLPDYDSDFRKGLSFDAHTQVCRSCGHVVQKETNPGPDCGRCKANEWEEAVVSSK
jgi:uncharacterized membrane protein YcaP (DUF421 family)